MKADTHNHIKLDGCFYINDKLITEQITVGFSDESIGVSDKYPGTHHRIGFSPFSKRSLLKGTFSLEKKQQGFFYEISGTWLGGYNHGPLGHPGDGENNYYRLTKVRIDIKYTEEGIKVLISGNTEKGRDEKGNENLLPAVSFKTAFLIPPQKFQVVFEMDDYLCESFIKKNFPKYA